MPQEWLDRISPCIDRSAGTRPFPGPVINPLRVISNHELFMFGPGDGEMVVEDVPYACPGNSFVIIPPGVRHVSFVKSKQPVTVRWAHFNWTYVPENRPEYRVIYPPSRPDPATFQHAPDFVPKRLLHGAVRSSRVFELHDRMAYFYRSDDPRDRRLARSVFLREMLELLLPERLPAPAGDLEAWRVEQCRDRLIELAQEPLSTATPLKQALADLGCSYFHLERLFRRAYGVSPLRYVNTLRLERIKSLLRDTDRPISNVAQRLGFADPGYFSRFFKKHAGCTPRAFRAHR